MINGKSCFTFWNLWSSLQFILSAFFAVHGRKFQSNCTFNDENVLLRTENALLDIFHAVVVFIEDLSSSIQFQILHAADSPRQSGQPVEIIAGHVEFRRMIVEETQFVEFLVDDFLDGVRNRFVLEPSAEFLVDGVFIVLLQSQFFFDDFQLFLQHVLSVLGFHLLLYLTTDFLLQTAQLQLLLQQR